MWRRVAPEATRRGRRRQAHQRHGSHRYVSEILTEPGDLCAFLRPTETAQQNNSSSSDMTSSHRYMCLYIAHFRPQSDGSEREKIVWLSKCTWQHQFRDGSTVHIGIEELGCCVVTALPRVSKRSEEHSERLKSLRPAPRSGKLEDGSKYMTYPIMLYHDDFNPASLLFPQGSVGGCYFMPINFSNRSRSSVGSARVVSLTPPGMKTTEVLKYIVEDVVKGAVEGVACTDAHGNDVRVFLDTVGFVSDYRLSLLFLT